jgi:hypothetical protein
MIKDYRDGIIMFPIQDGMIRAIPWEAIALHSKQAHRNHGQSIEALAQRMGLSPCEACAVLEDRPWSKMDKSLARVRLMQLIKTKEPQC